MKEQKIISLNPSKNYEIIGEISITTKAEIDKKVNKAHLALEPWIALGVKGRKNILENLYKEFIKRKNEISSLAAKEMGMPISVSEKIDIEAGLQYMRGYLDFCEQWISDEIIFENDQEVHYLTFEPKGVAGVSIPWNYPFCNFIWGVIQNLIVGNTVVFKHSEECPLTAKLLEDIIVSVNLPEGVFNQVFGDGSDVGEYIMNSEIDFIYFTGSTGVGKHLYQIAAKKFIPAMLELGGSAPGIIFEDADLDKVIELVYFYRFLNNGQTCDGLKRLIVHRSCFDDVVQKLKAIVSTKKIGDAENTNTDLGPLVAERQVVALEKQVADAIAKNAKIIIGGKRPSGLMGAYYEPTIITNVTFEMSIWRDEVFGPVLPIVPFDTEEEAIKLANDTQYGLGGYIYTKDKNRALRVAKLLKTGNININSANYVIAQDPFGGYKNSGIGREHGKQGFRELCNSKVIALKK